MHVYVWFSSVMVQCCHFYRWKMNGCSNFFFFDHSTNVGPPMSVPTSVHMASKSCSSFVRGTFFQCIERSGTSNVAKKPEDFERPKCNKSSILNDLIEVIKCSNQFFAEVRCKKIPCQSSISFVKEITFSDHKRTRSIQFSENLCIPVAFYYIFTVNRIRSLI